MHALYILLGTNREKLKNIRYNTYSPHRCNSHTSEEKQIKCTYDGDDSIMSS